MLVMNRLSYKACRLPGGESLDKGVPYVYQT